MPRSRLRGRALAHPADDLHSEGDRKSDSERDQEALERAVLERLAPDVAEQTGIRAPDRAGGDVELDEAGPGPLEASRGERGGGPAAGDEPGDDDQVAAAFLEQ